MSDIRPFRGIRPRPDLAPQIAAPPYDVVDFEEGVAYVADKPDSFMRVEKSEIELDASLHVHDTQIFENGARNLKRLLDEQKMIMDPTPCYYLYRQKMGDHVQTGVVAGASVDEYEAGEVKIHEFTREVKEKERTMHVDLVGANTGPVFLTYKASAEIDDFVEKFCSHNPDVDFVSEDGLGHTLWVVSAPPDVGALKEMFGRVPALYVADGHHRSAAACNVRAARKERNEGHTGEEAYNHFLTVIFPHDQMMIMEYNRVVMDLNGMTANEVMDKVSGRFEVSETTEPSPPAAKQFGMFVGGKWYRLTAREGTFPAGDPVESLDVAILQKNLLAPILGIGDPRKDERIQFVGGIRGSAELEKRATKFGGAGFALYATSITQLMSVADAGKVMPPKSTWFEPKLRSGMVVRSIND